MRTERSQGPWLRRPLLIGCVALVLASVACSSSSAGQAASSGEATASSTAPGDSAPSGKTSRSKRTPAVASSDALPTPALAAGSTPGGAVPGGSSSPGPGYHGGPPPANFPFKSKVPVDASLDPLCVTPGSTLSLHVVTKPKAAVVFNAVYEDGYGGGPPPFGKGYGGNDKGYADDDGAFSATWVVAPNAPPGRGRVDVVIGFSGKWGYEGPHFGVADSDGNCPEQWMRKTDHAEDGKKK